MFAVCPTPIRIFIRLISRIRPIPYRSCAARTQIQFAWLITTSVHTSFPFRVQLQLGRATRDASLFAESHHRARSLTLAPRPNGLAIGRPYLRVLNVAEGRPLRLSRAPEASSGSNASRQSHAAWLLHMLGARDTGTGIELVSRYRG